MKTAQAHNALLTGSIEIKTANEILSREREKLRLRHLMDLQREISVDPIRYPNYWQAVNYKRVLDPESGFHVYPWEITPTWRGIKKVGRGNVSAEAI